VIAKHIPKGVDIVLEIVVRWKNENNKKIEQFND
jgi:hypothetical protein